MRRPLKANRKYLPPSLTDSLNNFVRKIERNSRLKHVRKIRKFRTDIARKSTIRKNTVRNNIGR